MRRLGLAVLSVGLWAFLTISAGAVGASDIDGDGIDDSADNCETVANPDQTDIKFDSNGDPIPNQGDGTGDACQNYGDIDFDGIRDPFDNCSQDFNPAQVDVDGDGFGNWCDGDFDNNGAENQLDLDALLLHFGCEAGGPPFDPLYDLDDDACVDALDSQRFSVLMQRESPPGPSLLFCADEANPTSPCAFPEDGDFDGDDVYNIVDNIEDNCPFLANSDQTDTDHDGYGNRCDADFNNSGTVNATDFSIFISCFGADPADQALDNLGNPCSLHDFNDTNTVNVTDYGFFFQFFTSKTVGPSGLSCAGAPCPLGPFLEPVGAQTVAVGSSLAFELVATNPSGSGLTFGVSPQPLIANSTFDTSTGRLTFAPQPGQAGVVDLVFSANDGTFTASETVSITVTAAAPGGPTSFSGRLLDANAFADFGLEEPVINARVSLYNTGFHTQTDSQGYFTLDTTTDDTPLDPTGDLPFPSGAQVFDIDTIAPAPDTAELASDEMSTFSSFREAITLIDGVANVVQRPFYLTRIDSTSGEFTDPYTTADIEASIGVQMTVVANSAQKDGVPYIGYITVSEVPAGYAPAALPAELEPNLLITIQPVGLTFNPPAQITFPNHDNLPTSTTEVSLWSLDAEAGAFHAVAAGQVTSTGINSLNGGVVSSSWHCMCSNGQQQDTSQNQTTSDEAAEPPATCNSCPCPDDTTVAGGSVFEIATGALLESHTLAPYQSLSRFRALRFSYDSTLADPQPIIRSDLTIKATNAIPQTFSTRLEVAGVVQGPDRYTSPATPADPLDSQLDEALDETILTAHQFDAMDMQTGRYSYRFWQRSNYAMSTISTIDSGFVLVNNQSKSPYGAGWTLDGVQRIHKQGNDVILTEGDGSALFFSEADAFVIGSLDASDVAAVNGHQGQLSFAQGSLYSQARAAIQAEFPDASFVGLTDLTPASLAGIDILVQGTQFARNYPAPDPFGWRAGWIFSFSAQQAVLDFVEAGGRALILGDVDKHADNPVEEAKLFDTFGIALTQNPANALLTRDAVIDVPFHPITQGPFGTYATYRHVLGGRMTGPAYLEVVAQENSTINHGVIEAGALQPGAGSVVLHGGLMFQNDIPEIASPTFAENRNLLLNEIAYLSEGIGGGSGLVSPPGDFSTLVRNPDGSFTRTMKDGTVHAFDADGLHVSTTDPNENVTQFLYDATTGLLDEIVDPTQEKIFLNYVGGLITSVVGPAGITSFEHDANGNLKRITDPDQSERKFTYDSRHRMKTQTSKRGFSTQYAYDHAGRISTATLPDQSVRTLINAQSIALVDTSTGQGLSKGTAVPFKRPKAAVSTYIDAESRTRTYGVDLFGRPLQITLDDGGSGLSTLVARNNPAGLANVVDTPSGDLFISAFDDRGNLLSVEDVSLGGTTIFGGYDTVPVNYVKSIEDSRQEETLLSYEDLDNPGTFLTTVTKITTPELRESELRYTADGLVREVMDTLDTTTTFTYDPATRNLTQIEQGTGLASPRVTALTYYPSSGYVHTLRDPEDHLMTFTYDDMGRVETQTLIHDPPGGVGKKPGTQLVSFTYENDGRLSTLTPPPGGSSDPTHGFDNDDRDREDRYEPPPVSPADPATRFFYNLESQLTEIERPDLQSLELDYDLLGRLDAVTLQPANELYDLVYGDPTGLLTSSSTPSSGPVLTFGYTGSRLTAETTSGAFTNPVVVSWHPDGDGRLDDRTVTGTALVDFDYDGDGLLTVAGAETLGRDPATGLLGSTTLGSVTTTLTYDPDFPELDHEIAEFNATTTLYENTYSIRDQLGRLVEKTETVEGGAPTTLLYEYDFAGRLERVTTTGASSSVVDYAYDDNGNRLSRTVQGSPPEAATYDDQDRLVSYGTLTFTYNENGDLESKTDTMVPETTTYVYDARGNLRSVTLPDTTVVSYDHDARDRRVVRRVNGSFDFGLVYGDALNPVAKVDASGAVVSRFVYGSRANVPDYMLDVSSGNTYRLLSDHLGSVRLVVDVSSGVVAQRIDYDEFGNVTAESGSGFQPFGFAGGLYDPDTQLVRFGARDYDPRVGRWTAKDPIRFGGGDANLYGYVLNDPVNFSDSNGLIPDAMGEPRFRAACEASIPKCDPNDEGAQTNRELAVDKCIGNMAAQFGGAGAQALPGSSVSMLEGIVDSIVGLLPQSIQNRIRRMFE